MTIDNPTFFISLVNFVVRSLPEILVSLPEFFLMIIEAVNHWENHIATLQPSFLSLNASN